MATLTQKNPVLLVLLSLALLALIFVSFAWYQASRTPTESNNTSNNTLTPNPQESTKPTEDDTDANEYHSPKGVLMRVDTPKANSSINSPVNISGTVPGSWAFEANFPIEIQDSARQVISEGYATLSGDWMTTEQVPFSASITFDATEGQNGFIVLRKANASGLPEHDDYIEIPVSF